MQHQQNIMQERARWDQQQQMANPSQQQQFQFQQFAQQPNIPLGNNMAAYGSGSWGRMTTNSNNNSSISSNNNGDSTGSLVFQQFTSAQSWAMNPQAATTTAEPSFNVNNNFFGMFDEKAIPQEEVSLLNKVLNDKINQLNEGTPEVSKLQRDPNSPLYSAHTFEDLRLKPELIMALRKMGFQQPSKIQEAALPVLLSEPPQDIIAQSQSGTGKTATFLLAMLQRLNPALMHPQCICVAPTFELAQQIGEVAIKMSQFLTNVRIRFAVKGETVPRNATFPEQIVIGTPGKMLDWITRKHIDTSKIISFALDEADVMISQQGYQDKSIRIHNEIIAANPSCQCMLFSATYSDAIFQFAEKLIADPTIITIRRQDQSLPYIRQYYVRCRDREDKYQAILSLYSVITVSSCIIFCYTRASTIWLAQRFREKGRDVALLHGELPVDERARVVEQFKQGQQKVMITTNVVARGLDIPQVSLVINYDPPVTFEEMPQPDYDTYLHRMGRTGRFGKPGIVINLVDSDIAMNYVWGFQTHFGREIQPLDANDYDQMERIEQSTRTM